MGERASRIVPLSNNTDILNVGIEPFLIFCYQRRQLASQQNPFLNSSGITSLLGSIWRSMKDEEKQIYTEMAMQIKSFNKIKNIFPLQHITCDFQSPKTQQSYTIKNKDLKQTQNKTNLYIPKITIMSRNGFGTDAAEISNKTFK